MEKLKIANNGNNMRGVTLIVLIITIIIILIIAGATINSVLGDNGVLSHAEKSGKEQKYKSSVEQIQMQIEHKIGGGNIGNIDIDKTYDNINNLNKQQYCIESLQRGEDNILVILEDNRKIKIDKTGNLIELED